MSKMFDQKEPKNEFKKDPRSSASALRRSSSIDNSNSAVGASLNNSNSVFCISQNSANLSDDHSDDDREHREASRKNVNGSACHSTNRDEPVRISKHSARVRSRGKSTDRLHHSDQF